MDWKELTGKKIRVWFDDGEKISSKVIVVEGVTETTLFYDNGCGISLFKIIRHEVMNHDR